jgi:hypothetical protein
LDFVNNGLIGHLQFAEFPEEGTGVFYRVGSSVCIKSQYIQRLDVGARLMVSHWRLVE